MDASSSQDHGWVNVQLHADRGTEKIVEPPRNLFFGVEDRRLGGRTGLTDKYVLVEKSRRYQLAETVINSAIQVANAVRTMRTFDRTGNADQVLDHLTCSLDDLVKQTNNLIAEVEKSVDRYGDGLDELAARDAAEAAASLNTPAGAVEEPTPQAPAAAAGPTRLDGTPGPSPADVAAQVKANLDRALDRIEVEATWSRRKVEAYR